MIHINEPLSAEARTSLENTMRKVEGVISPGLDPDKEHLLVITYNSDKTNTPALLEKAREAGYTAQLVGMQRKNVNAVIQSIDQRFWKRLSMAGFAFFLMKGLIWLTVPVVMYLMNAAI